MDGASLQPMFSIQSRHFSAFVLVAGLVAGLVGDVAAQVGRRFPSEKKIVPDPVTGIPLTFLTSTPADDAKIYPTHPQWTADGQWLIFRSRRGQPRDPDSGSTMPAALAETQVQNQGVPTEAQTNPAPRMRQGPPSQAFAVHEGSGDIVQLTESGFAGILLAAQKSMKLFYMRSARDEAAAANPSAESGTPGRNRDRTMQMVELALDRVFADSASGKMQPAAAYERICGTIPAEWGAGGDMGLDANEDVVYFRVGRDKAAAHLPPNTKMEGTFGPRNMGAGPGGIASMDLKTGELKMVAAVPFQVGHLQASPEVPGELMFCWETGGKAPTRTWTVKADGSGLRPVYQEAEYDWVTHELFITKDEVAFAILGHRKAGAESPWGVAGTRQHATGLGIMNLRTGELQIAGQTKTGSGFWHVDGSPDGRWAVGDDFSRSLYLIDRRTGETMLLSTGHKATAADHPHPTFSADSKRIEIQSAMLSEDNRSMNICVIPVPEAWLKRTYDEKTQPPVLGAPINR